MKIACGALALAGVFVTPAFAQNAPSATAYYEAALNTTKSLPQPAYIAFTTTVVAEGLTFHVTPYHTHEAWLGLGLGDGSAPHSWQSDHRASTDTTVILTGDGERLRALSPLYDPTWDGANDWMRYGVFSAAQPPYDPQPHTQGSPVPQVMPSDSTIKTIAVVSVMGAKFYRIDDGGRAACPNGAPGHALRLSAIRDPDLHPLTGVIVDVASSRFCSMQFRIGNGSALGLTGSSELHFNDVGGYWMTTDGTTTFLVRVLGIGVKKAVLHFSYHDVTFPPALPDSLFDFSSQ